MIKMNRMLATKPIFFLTEEDVYNGDEPIFYDGTQFEWVKILENNWTVIRDEFRSFIEDEADLKLSSSNPPFLSDPKAWKNLYFLNFLWKKHETCKRFPKTYELLRSIPDLTFAELTVLEPGTSILPHIGETNTTIRGHLGLSIPGTFPELGIEVKGEQRGWENGKVTLFSDAHRHRVWNLSNGRRFVLVFDVVRKPFNNQKLWVCAQCLGALSIKWVDARKPIFKKLPKSLQHAAHKLFSVAWYLYLPVQRKTPWLP